MLAGALLLPAPARAQGFNQIGFNTTGTAVTLVTTTENVAIASGPVTAPRQSVNVCILAFAQLTTGTNTTAVVARIRRGTAITGTLVSEENEEIVKAAAGSIEPFFAMVCEDRADVATVEYALTLDQVGASANGSVIFSTILVFVR